MPASIQPKTTIYGLVDPRTKQLKYIGKTRYQTWHRLSGHLQDAKKGAKTYKNNWISSLLKLNLRPEIIVIDQVQPENEVEAEMFYIEYFKSLGCKLSNLTKGGDGVVGHKHSLKTRKLLSNKLKGKIGNRKGATLSEESKNRMRKAKRYKMKAIEVINTVTKVVYKFDSIREAAKTLNLSRGNIKHVLNKTYTQTRGYTVRYI